MSKYNTSIIDAVFDTSGLAIVSGWVKIYHCHPLTREFIGAGMDFVHIGMSIPADSYIDEPKLPTKKNIAVCRSSDGNSWEFVPDFRGSVAYNKNTREAVIINSIGDISSDLTLIAPSGPFDKWNGKQWVTDKKAESEALIATADSKKKALLVLADAKVATLQDAVDLNMATDEEKKHLIKWKVFRVEVNRIDTSLTDDIQWPCVPE